MNAKSADENSADARHDLFVGAILCQSCAGTSPYSGTGG